MSKRSSKAAARLEQRDNRLRSNQKAPSLDDFSLTTFTKPTKRNVQPLNDAQRRYDAAMRSAEIVFGIGPAGTGKAQPLDALIKTPNGWSSMENMSVGTNVVTASGNVATVVAVYPQGKKDIYRITFEDGRTAECCDEHLWRVYRDDWRPKTDRWRIVPTSEMRRLLALSSAKDRLYVELITPYSNESIPLPVEPYLLGALLGDGHLGAHEVRISSADKFILGQIELALPLDMKIHHAKAYDYTLVNTSRGKVNTLLNAIRSFGLAETGCEGKFIPEMYKNASPDQRLAVLQGLLDTDGSVCKTGSISFCSVSEQLALDVQEIVRSLGGLATIKNKKTAYSYKGEKHTGRIAYNVRIRIKQPRRLFRLPRKVEAISGNYQYENSLRLRIKAIDFVGSKQAQCIAIDHSSHLYVTNDYVATHNTWLAAMRAAQMLDDRAIEKIIVTRPAVEAGESLGFLPGELEEKYEPYFRPVRDALVQYFGASHMENLIRLGKIEARPLALLRGASIDNAWIIADEMQNATVTQLKLLLTRGGKNVKFIVNGDLRQIDLPHGKSGLYEATKRLEKVEGIQVVRFERADIVRSGLTQRVVEAFEGDGEDESREGLNRMLSPKTN